MIIDMTGLQTMEFLVPFAFSLAVIFGVLDFVHLFRGNKPVNFIIAFTLSLFAMSNSAFVSFMWENFVLVAVFFIVAFFILFIKKISGPNNKTDTIVINGAILFVLLSLSYAYMGGMSSIPIIGNSQNLILLIAGILILSMFWAAYKLGPAKQR
jgi:hypothetical protein